MRKNYTNELKTKIVLELLREEETISQIAAKYEIHPNQLSRWRKTVVESILENNLYYKFKPMTLLKLELLNKIDEIYTKHPYYGSRRMTAVLN